MSAPWPFLVCQCLLIGLILCAQQKPNTHSHDDSVDEHQIHKYDQAFNDFNGIAQSHSVDKTPDASLGSGLEEEICTSVNDGHCDMEATHQYVQDGEKEEYYGEEDSSGSHGRRTKASGWFSDWDLMFSASEEASRQEESPDETNFFKKETSVKVLRIKGDFERFVRIGHVVIVFFYKDVHSDAMQRFLVEYDVSADHLLQYGIYLALADCNVYSIRNYCNAEKVNRFAYGFREGQEKIAFPLDTLFNNNAIVASALHLDLINSVPILQTAGERRELERRCKGRCDIIFSFQRTLGTYEHRMFLEIAHAYQDSYVFAITTYTAGTLGLSESLPQGSDDVEQRVWVVHCADKTLQQQCVVSHFRRKMLLAELLQFISALQLPKWHDLDVSPTKNIIISPYDGTSLPWVILIYDSSCKHRVLGLAPDLGQLFHGSVATITLNLDKINQEALESLGLKKGTIVTPALAFLHQEQEKTALLNDYDDPLEWVNEQLTAIFEKPQSKEELGYQPVQPLEELLQDDEIVMDMQSEETFVNVPPLNGPEALTSAIKSSTLTLIAFYLAWDPVSSMLLQHMNEIVPHLGQLGSQAVLHRVNCFDWPRLCDGLGVAGYPELRIYPENKENFTYNGPIHSGSLMKTILLYGKPPPVELHSMEELESFLSLQQEVHQACYLMQAAAVGIFPSVEGSVSFMEAAQALRSSHLTARYISKEDTKDVCDSDSGCILISKPKDLLQPRVVLQSELDSSSKIAAFLRHSADFVLAPLDFERLSILSSANGVGGQQSLSNQYLILFFIPSDSSLPFVQGFEKQLSTTKGNSNDNNEQKNSHKEATPPAAEIEMWSVFGRLAVEFSEPGFVFSWIKGDTPLAEKLISVYHLLSGDFNLVAVNWKHKSFIENEKVKGDKHEESIINIYPCPDLSPMSLRPWLISLKEGLLKPSVVLGDNDWEPRLPGFDYIKFMMEDEDRDAEDQLILEMENDLSSHSHHGEDGDGLLHIHKEL